MSEANEAGNLLRFGLKDTKPSSQPNLQKLSAFQIAPARKSAFDRAKEEAQKRAERELEETAAAYADFAAEFGATDEQVAKSFANSNALNTASIAGPGQRTSQKRPHTVPTQETTVADGKIRGAFDEYDSEEEERERRRLKLKSSSSYLNELKKNNKKREKYREEDRFELERKSTGGTQKQDVCPKPPTPKDQAREDQRPEIVEEDDEDSNDDIDYYRGQNTLGARRVLSTTNKAKLKHALDSVTSQRASIARVMAFAMTHAACFQEISEIIVSSISEPDLDWRMAVARLWCISDILHNSWVPIPNAWKYRSSFEDKLEMVMESLKTLGATIESRIRCENFRRIVTGVIQNWSTWICFTDGFTERLSEAFEDNDSPVVEAVPEAKQTKKLSGWKKVGDMDNALDPSTVLDIKPDEMECRPNLQRLEAADEMSQRQNNNAEVDSLCDREMVHTESLPTNFQHKHTNLDSDILAEKNDSMDSKAQIISNRVQSIQSRTSADVSQSRVENRATVASTDEFGRSEGPSALVPKQHAPPPKIKMAFGRLSRPVAVDTASSDGVHHWPNRLDSSTRPEDSQPEPQLDEYEKLALEHRLQVESDKTHGDRLLPAKEASYESSIRREVFEPPASHSRPGVNRKIPQRRSAADFMD